jgi:hypothetical protein
MAFFQFFRNYQVSADGSGASLEFTVPTNKELIIEFVSGSGNVLSGQIFFVVFQLVSDDNTSKTTGVYFIPVQMAGAASPSSDIFVFAQSMRVHVDPGTKVLITLPAGTGQGSFTMTGQILDAGTSGTSVTF